MDIPPLGRLHQCFLSILSIFILSNDDSSWISSAQDVKREAVIVCLLATVICAQVIMGWDFCQSHHALGAWTFFFFNLYWEEELFFVQLSLAARGRLLSRRCWESLASKSTDLIWKRGQHREKQSWEPDSGAPGCQSTWTWQPLEPVDHLFFFFFLELNQFEVHFPSLATENRHTPSTKIWKAVLPFFLF